MTFSRVSGNFLSITPATVLLYLVLLLYYKINFNFKTVIARFPTSPPRSPRGHYQEGQDAQCTSGSILWMSMMAWWHLVSQWAVGRGDLHQPRHAALFHAGEGLRKQMRSALIDKSHCVSQFPTSGLITRSCQTWGSPGLPSWRWWSPRPESGATSSTRSGCGTQQQQQLNQVTDKLFISRSSHITLLHFLSQDQSQVRGEDQEGRG